MTLEEATGALNKSGISYRIEYKDTKDEKDNTVIKQSIKANKKIENTEIVTITIARNNTPKSVSCTRGTAISHSCVLLPKNLPTS